MDPDETKPVVAAPTVVITEPPEEPEHPAESESALALNAISERIEAVENRITTAIEGERTWTTETITSLREEIAAIKANLSEIAQGFPAQVQALRDELTQLSQSLQTPVAVEVEAEPVIPVVEPGALPVAVEGTPTDAPAKNAPPKGKRRVV